MYKWGLLPRSGQRRPNPSTAVRECRLLGGDPATAVVVGVFEALMLEVGALDDY